MNTSSPQRFNGLADRYASSEVYSSSPPLDRLHAILPQVESVCDVASGAGHTGLGFADITSSIVAADPAPSMLAQCQRLAAERGVSLETLEAFAEAIPLPSESFDQVNGHLAAHHFVDLPKAMSAMTGIAKQGGHVAIVGMEGDEGPSLDDLNHEIEVLHDPTHVRSYTAQHWRGLFMASGLEIETCETRFREIPNGLTFGRWCDLSDSGPNAMQTICDRLAAAPPLSLGKLDITRDADGEFRIPVRSLLIIGRKTHSQARQPA
jgi:SAM-dependent methyltransferase